MTIRRTTVFILCVVFSLATTVVDAADRPASSLKDLLSSLMQPTLAANTTSVDHYLMRFGNTVFTLTGDVEGVLGAGETVGFAFKGEGQGAITKKDYRPFFERYIYGTEVPAISD